MVLFGPHSGPLTSPLSGRARRDRRGGPVSRRPVRRAGPRSSESLRAPNRRPLPLLVSRLHPDHQSAQYGSDAADGMDTRQNHRGHGQGRRRHVHRLDERAERVVRRQRGGAEARAGVQRVRRQADGGLPGAVRRVRDAAVARRRRLASRNRIRLRHAQGRRRLLHEQLPGQVSRRPGVCARDGRAQSPAGGLPTRIRSGRSAASICCRTAAPSASRSAPKRR